MKLIILLLLLIGCQKSSQWSYDNIPAKHLTCRRLIHHTQDPIQGIDVEILQSEGTLTTYLQLKTPLPGKHTQVRLIADGQVIEAAASIHAGGQRIELPKELRESLLQLLESRDVTITLKGYHETLESEAFNKGRKKLKSSSHIFQTNEEDGIMAKKENWNGKQA